VNFYFTKSVVVIQMRNRHVKTTTIQQLQWRVRRKMRWTQNDKQSENCLLDLQLLVCFWLVHFTSLFYPLSAALFSFCAAFLPKLTTVTPNPKVSWTFESKFNTQDKGYSNLQLHLKLAILFYVQVMRRSSVNHL